MADRDKSTSSKLKVINRALALLGSDRLQLNSLTDTSTVSQQTELHFTPALEELIRMHAWNCCLDRLLINQAAVNSPFFPYAKGVNADTTMAVKPLRILTRYDSASQNGGVVRPQTEWALYHNDEISSGHRRPQVALASESDESWRFYLLQIPLTSAGEIAYNKFDSQFVNCWVHYLASKLAVPVAGNVNRKFELLKCLYEKLLPEARKANTLEGSYVYTDQNNMELPKPFSYESIVKV